MAITVWYKTEIKQDFEKKKTPIFQYKQSKIVWSAVGIGLLTILIARDIDSELKILTLIIGLYLILSQAVEFVSGKHFKTNILAFSDEYLIDLNGRIRRIKYKDIKGYNQEKGTIKIQEKHETYKIKQKNFINSENMIEQIENDYLSQVNKAR